VTTAAETRRVFVEGPDVDALRDFVLARWRERADEMRLVVPEDLSSSCKFGALLVRELHGGEIRGNWAHVHCRLPCGGILDPSRWAEDVETIRARELDPYEHDRTFIRSRDFRDSLETCIPRVKAWADEWRMAQKMPGRKAA